VENQNNRKFTILAFFIISVIFGYVFYRGLTQVVDWMKVTNTITAALHLSSWKVAGGLISGVTAFIAFLILATNSKATSFSDEVFAETRKVTWPSGQDTYRTTLVVGIMVGIAGVMLFLLDNIWNWIFKAILS